MTTLCIDFDGVIHKASKGYVEGKIYDPPTEGSVFTLNNLARRYNLVVLTARPPEDFPKIKKWLKKYSFPEMEVTNTKPKARAYIDDRAVRFTSWPDIVHYFL